MSENKEFNFNFVHLVAILFLILVFAFICYLIYFPFEYVYYSRLSPNKKVDLKVKQTKEINDLLIVQVKLDTDFNKYKLNLNNNDYDSFKIVNFNNEYDYCQGLCQ